MLASRSFALWLPYRGEATLSWMRSLFARSSVAVRVIIDRGVGLRLARLGRREVPVAASSC